jgi:hypothetical protein
VFDRSGITPLHYAARAGRKLDVKALLKHGADPMIADLNGGALGATHGLALGPESRGGPDAWLYSDAVRDSAPPRRQATPLFITQPCSPGHGRSRIQARAAPSSPG